MKYGYSYIFYVFYKHWEKAPSRWWSEWKALISIVFLWILLLSAIDSYQMYLIRMFTISDYPISTLIVGSLIPIIHYYKFIYKDKWKMKIEKYRDVSKRKDAFGILFVILLTAFIISNYVIAVNLLKTIDWANMPK